MRAPNPLDIAKLVPSCLASLKDVVTEISSSAQIEASKARHLLATYGLPRLRPLVACWGPDVQVVEDCSSQTFIDALSLKLDSLSVEAASKDAHQMSVQFDFSWAIPDLVAWCRLKKLSVPKTWESWMRETYPLLRERELIYPPRHEQQEAPRSGAQNANAKMRKGRKNFSTRDALLYKEAKKLQKKHPRHSKRAIAELVAKTDINHGLKPESIKRILRAEEKKMGHD